MAIEVVKIGRYDPTLNGRYSRYEGYALSASNKTDPSLTPEARQDLHTKRSKLKGQVIFHSPRLRAIETAAILAGSAPNKPQREEPSLTEIPFNMRHLVTQQEYESAGSNLVRERFVDAFVDDALLETRMSILQRAQYLLGMLAGLEYDVVTLVSHSFFMKVLEATVQGLPLEKDPEILRTLINPTQKTYPFGEGFTFEHKNR